MVRLTEFPGYPAGSMRPVMKPEGNGSSGILCMGEALGEHEDREGLPFRPYAEAGSVLERALYRAGISRESLTITNLVWYRPPRNWLDGAPWQDDAIRVCQPLNDELIERVRPRVILALGGMAFRELTGMSGAKQGIEMCRGFIVPAVQYRTTYDFSRDKFFGDEVREDNPWKSLPVVGTYHPSYLRRGSKERTEEGPKGKTKAAGGGTQGMNLLGVLIRDLQLAQDIAKNGAKQFQYDDYKLGATLDDWEEFYRVCCAHPEALLVDDWETSDTFIGSDETELEKRNKDIHQVQMSWRTGQAIVSAWTPDLVRVLRKIQALPNAKGDWYGRLGIDREIWRNLEVSRGGHLHDLSDMWHHAQPDLPKGLQFATSFFCPEVGPWKHLSHTTPLWYGALDVDMPQRIFSALKLGMSLQREPHSGVSLWGDGKYGGYTGQVLRLAPALDRMSARGIPVDETKRNELDIQFTRTLLEQFAQLQGMVPDSVKGVHVYKKAGTKEPCEYCEGTGKMQADEGRKTPKCAICSGKGTITVEPVLGAPTMIKIKQGTETREVPSVWTQVQDEVSEKCDCSWAKPKRKPTKAEVLEIGDPRRMTGYRTEVLLENLYAPCERCLNTGKVRVLRNCWAKVEPFLPGSPQQVMRYIKHKLEEDIQDRTAKYLNRAGGPQEARAMAERLTPWKVPTDHKTGAETTSEMELRRLADKTGDAVLPLVLDYREISKLRGTYVQGWKPGPDGRVHSTFGYRPATGQLSCVAPWTPIHAWRGREIPIHEIEVGDRVLTHQRRWRKVTHLWNKGPGEMVEVKFSNGKVLTCTTDHRLLVYPYECLEVMGYALPDRTSYCDVQVLRNADSGSDGEAFQDATTDPGSDPAFAHSNGGICRAQGRTLFPGEDRGKESGLWKNAAQLHRDCGRWVRVSDLYEGWKAAVCASGSYGRIVGADYSSRDLRRASYRREFAQQQSGQLGPDYATWASRNSLPSSEGYTIVTITEINPVGSYEVYDITVDEDGSYAACGVFSHNSEEPNAQNFPQHSELAHVMKQMIAVLPGRKLIKFDWKSFHVLTAGFEAQDPDYVRIARVDMHSFLTLVGLLRLTEPEVAFAWQNDELKDRLKHYKKSEKVYQEYARQKHPAGMTFKEIRDEIAKRCIAEGQLVLTDKGLVPIEKITLGHKLWDGVEWVQHSGVVYKGIREVITYEGLTATPDHEVYTEKGELVPFGLAALCTERLDRTGIGREAVRTGNRDLIEDQEDARRKNEERREALQAFILSMQNLPQEKLDKLLESSLRAVGGLSTLHADLLKVPTNPGSEVRCNCSEMHESEESELCGLWGQRDSESVRQPEGVRAVCREESSASGLQRDRDRQEEQQWTLYSGELAVGDPSRTEPEQAEQSVDGLQGREDSLHGSIRPIEGRLSGVLAGKTTYGEIGISRRAVVDDLGTEGTRPVQKARVYDIVNAGPRRCFTVSDVLVHNCVFGWEFGQGPRSLYMLWQEIFANESEAAKCQNALKRLFPKVDQWQSDVRLEADRLTQLMTRFGFVRRFYDVYQRKPVADNYQARGNERIYQNGKTGQKWLLKPGDDHEACIALRPANDAFGIKRMVMVQLMEEGLDERFGLINEIHDALVFDCDAAREAECVERATKIMTAPCPYLKDPVVAPEGLWCGVSLAIGTNWDNFEEV